MTIEATLAEARRHHAAGRAEQAGRAYQRVLALDPARAEAAHLYGVLALQLGQPGPALELADQAVALRPATAAFHAARGDALLALGRPAEAADSFREAARRKPGAATFHAGLGRALDAQGLPEEAVAALRRATRADPKEPGAWNSLGTALRGLGRHGEAAAAFSASLRAAPEEPVAMFHHAASLADDGRTAEAADAFGRLVSRTPDDPRAHLHLFKLLTRLGRDAEAPHAALLRLAPDDPVMHNEAANALREAGRPEQAEPHAQAAARLAPSESAFHENLASLLRALGRYDEALDAFAEAQRLKPDDPKARFGLALCRLSLGDLKAGWEGYEDRYSMGGPPRFAAPPWTGGRLDGTLLVHGEQGFGDAIQMCRYVRLAAERATRVVVQVRPPLLRLMAGLPGMAELLAHGPAPAFDAHCPMMSLPRAFGTTLETIPPAPYLAADPALTQAWRGRLAGMPGLRVGIVWAGNPDYLVDADRSIPSNRLAPLRDVPGARFVSLQKGAPAPWPGMTDWTAELSDFADTAALVEALDLVVAVDTAVAHLAGALGRPVWLLNRFDADWRWLRGRADSPWYPSMRLFRQPRIGDWDGVVADVAAALREAAPRRVAECATPVVDDRAYGSEG